MNSTLNLIHAFPQFPQVTAFFTTRGGGVSAPPFDSLNLGYLTRDFQPNVAKNWEILANELGIGPRDFLLPRLIHSDIAVTEQEFSSSEGRPEADAVFTTSLNKAPVVTAADCLPILIYCPQIPLAGGVHAGWKGTQKQILGKCLKRLMAKYNIEPQQIYLSFGPCIGTHHYQVKDDVAKQFRADFIESLNGEKCLNLEKANMDQALQLKIPVENMLTPAPAGSGQPGEFPRCTYCNPEHYFSHRRDGAHSGRMAAIIKLAL